MVFTGLTEEASAVQRDTETSEDERLGISHLSEDEKFDQWLALTRELGIDVPSKARDTRTVKRFKRKCEKLGIAYEEGKRRALELWIQQGS